MFQPMPPLFPWALLLSFAMALSGIDSARSAENGAWRHDAIWDDGNAEFATYEINWPRYGYEFTGRAILVLVKEPWAPDLQVKVDTPRPDGFEVLKLNHLRDGKLSTHSYFDGQGDQQTSWPQGALPWAGLPALLRDYVLGEAPLTVAVFTSLLTGRFGELRAQNWQLKKRFLKNHQVPAGDFAAYEIELSRKDQRMTYVFDAAIPHVLLQYHNLQGTNYRLAKVQRIPYWSMHRPGDESRYPESLRQEFTK